MKEFVTVGRVKDAHGLKGELYVTLFAGEAAWLKKLKQLRLLSPVDPITANGSESAISEDRVTKTFAVRSARAHKNGIIVLSPEIRGRTEAEKLKGWMLEIPQEFLISAKGEEIYLIEIKDFMLDVEGRGEVGQITGFSTNGAQDLLIVKTESGDFEIPFVKAFVLGIDYEARIVRMTLPEGLLGEPVDDVGPVADATSELEANSKFEPVD